MMLDHVVINGWFAGQPGTGSGQYLHHMLEALPVVSPATRWTLLVPPGAACPTWRGVTVIEQPVLRVRGPLRKVYWEQWTLPRAATQLAASVLWTPYWASPLFSPVPTVVTIHDLIPLLLPAYGRGAGQRLYNLLVSASARRATRVITVSKAGARDVAGRLGIAPARVTPVHHGPNFTGRAEPADMERVSARYRLPARYFLYMGGFDTRKNVATLLAAYARYLAQGGDPALRLVVGGRLPEADTPFAPDPRRMARELDIATQVDFIGWVQEDDKAALYAGATAFLYPSLYEGFGMPLLEAMQAGTAVVSSDR